MIMLTYDKNFVLTVLQFSSKISKLWDGLTQIQFDIQNVFGDIKTFLISKINLTLIIPPDLQYLLYNIKVQQRLYSRLDLWLHQCKGVE